MTNKTLIIFLISFASFYLIGLKFFTSQQTSKINHQIDIQPEVLAQSDESEISQTEKKTAFIAEPTSTVTATPTSTPTPTPTPTPIKTPDPTPTPSPSPTPTATPDPSPTPDPTPTPDVWSPPDMEPIFARYAGQYGVDKNILERIANCESHFNPNAGNSGYLGLFQFGERTWISTRGQMGEDTNLALRTDIDVSIKTAAYLISIRGTSPWPSCLR